MKIRFLLRGLGAGIFLTAVIMGIALPSEDNRMTDAQIRERALELGMVDEKDVLLPHSDKAAATDKKDEADNKGETEKKEASIDIDIAADKQDASDKKDTAGKENALAGKDEQPETKVFVNDKDEVKERDNKDDSGNMSMNSEKKNQTENFVLEIQKGASSYTVAKLLNKGGLVDNAEKFDEFLCDNGYDNRINSGVFNIPKDADYQEIADIISGKR